MSCMPIRWKVKKILETHQISNYRFWRDSSLSRQVAYDIANDVHDALDVRVIERLVPYMRTLTGNPSFQIGDVVEYREPVEKDSLKYIPDSQD